MASRLVRLAIFAAAITGVASNARADDVTVDCSGTTPGAYTTLGAALDALDIYGPHAIYVSGTCTESVYVTNRAHVRIRAVAGPGGPGTIAWSDSSHAALTVYLASDVTISGLVIRGGGVQVGASTVGIDHTTIENTTNRPGLVVRENAQVRMTDECVVQNGTNGGIVIEAGGYVLLRDVTVKENGSGISANGATLDVDGALTVENHNGMGISLTGGFARFNTWAGDNLIRNNGAGISLQGVAAKFNGYNVIQSNRNYGIQVSGAGSAYFNSMTTDGVRKGALIEGNGTLGLNIAASASVDFSGPHKIQNNGASAAASDWRGGLRVGSVSRVQFSGGAEVSDNIGPGIQAEFNGGMFLGNTVITNNTEEGVRILRNSVANLDAAMLAGNGLASVVCDSTALVIAGTGTLGPVRCPRIEREHGPPRPGIIKR